MSYITEAWEADLYKDNYIPSNKNTASKMSYECTKRLVLERTAPELKKPFTLEAIGRMAEGTEQEKQIRGWITLNPGTDIIRSQEPFEFEKLQLRGHFEGILEKKDEDPILFEIKTTEKYTYDKLYTIEDFYENRYWLGYLKQVTVYAKAAQMDRVLFIVKDRASRKPPKEFIYEVDESIWTAIKKKCRTVNAFVRRNEIPSDEYCNFDECKSCPFIDYCQPSLPQIFQGHDFVIDRKDWSDIAYYYHIKEENELENMKEEIRKKYNYSDTFISSGNESDDAFELTWSTRKRQGKEYKVMKLDRLA